MSPQRIQLRRTKGWRLPEGAISVSRPGPWGNPFKVGEAIRNTSDEWRWPYIAASVPGGARGFVSLKITTAAIAVDLFSCWFIESPWHMTNAFEQLPARDLACWCKIGDPCHGDWLLGLVNDLPDPSLSFSSVGRLLDRKQR